MIARPRACFASNLVSFHPSCRYRYEPKYSTIRALHAVLNAYAPTILRTPMPISAPTRQKQWRVTLNGSAALGDPPITFVFNDDDAPGTAPLQWSSWADDDEEEAAPQGTWHRASFARPALPSGAQLSVNLSGFGQGNLFVDGEHVAAFDLAFGECFAPPGGVNPHGNCDTYVWSRCDRPTQDCYHVPPSWLVDGDNVVLVWNSATLPQNVTTVQPALASVVYRVDPPLPPLPEL